MTVIRLSADERLDILELLGKYAWGIDHHDDDLLLQAFTDDPRVRYGTTNLRGHEQLLRWVHDYHAMHDSTQHFIAGQWITPREEDVLCRSYYIVTFTMKDSEGDVFQAGGSYTDRVVKTRLGWRISEHDAAEGFWTDGNQKIAERGLIGVAQLIATVNSQMSDPRL
jgi:hypothetical protein